YYERFVVAPDVESDARQHALSQVQTLRQRAQSSQTSPPTEPTEKSDDTIRAQTPPAEAGPDRTLSYIVLGSGVGLIATGAVFGMLASQDETKFQSAAPTDSATRQAARDSGTTKALVADGLFVAGGIAAVVGTYLFLTAKSPDT